MDKKIKKIQKTTKNLERQEASLLKMDKKMDAKRDKMEAQLKKKNK